MTDIQWGARIPLTEGGTAVEPCRDQHWAQYVVDRHDGPGTAELVHRVAGGTWQAGSPQ